MIHLMIMVTHLTTVAHLMTAFLSGGSSGPSCGQKLRITCITTLSVAHGYDNIFLCTI